MRKAIRSSGLQWPGNCCCPQVTICGSEINVPANDALPSPFVWKSGEIVVRYRSTLNAQDKVDVRDILREADWFDFVLPKEYRPRSYAIPLWRLYDNFGNVLWSSGTFDSANKPVVPPPVSSGDNLSRVPHNELLRVEIGWRVPSYRDYFCLDRPTAKILHRLDPVTLEDIATAYHDAPAVTYTIGRRYFYGLASTYPNYMLDVHAFDMNTLEYVIFPDVLRLQYPGETLQEYKPMIGHDAYMIVTTIDEFHRRIRIVTFDGNVTIFDEPTPSPIDFDRLSARCSIDGDLFYIQPGGRISDSASYACQVYDGSNIEWKYRMTVAVGINDDNGRTEQWTTTTADTASGVPDVTWPIYNQYGSFVHTHLRWAWIIDSVPTIGVYQSTGITIEEERQLDVPTITVKSQYGANADGVVYKEETRGYYRRRWLNASGQPVSTANRIFTKQTLIAGVDFTDKYPAPWIASDGVPGPSSDFFFAAGSQVFTLDTYAFTATSYSGSTPAASRQFGSGKNNYPNCNIPQGTTYLGGHEWTQAAATGYGNTLMAWN